MNQGILSAIGHTPLVKLDRVLEDCEFNLYAKLEGFNPGGSIKDRTAYSIIQHALDEGEIGPGTTVIESSSGNMGIGLAQICAYHGLRFICVVDPKTTKLNIEILIAFGAEVDLISIPDRATGEYLPARIARVQKLRQSIPDSFWPDQYRNIYNARAHHQTMLLCHQHLRNDARLLRIRTRSSPADKNICRRRGRQRDLWRSETPPVNSWSWRGRSASTLSALAC